MFFSDILGQEEIKHRLIAGAKSGKIAHAQLFYGDEGRGVLPMALAYAQYLSCENPKDNDSCGVCPSCKKYATLSHPDLHLIFPIIKKKSTDNGLITDEFFRLFRAEFLSDPYMSTDDWQSKIADSKIARIYTAEADNIVSSLSMKAFESKFKVVIIWGAEKTEPEFSNKLLKVLEEPQGQTLFILTTSQPNELLQTVRSRTQNVFFPPIDTTFLIQKLQKMGLDGDEFHTMAKNARGDLNALMKQIEGDEQKDEYFDLFKWMMRASIRMGEEHFTDMIVPFLDRIVEIGRSQQVAFLQNSQRLLREYFIYNLQQPQLLYMNKKEADFAANFAKFVNYKNIEDIFEELSIAQAQIEQNANARYIFMDLILKMYAMLKR